MDITRQESSRDAPLMGGFTEFVGGLEGARQRAFQSQDEMTMACVAPVQVRDGTLNDSIRF